MIELRNYSSTYTAGTYAAWAGAKATTQASCEASVLNVYVWRSDGTFLTSWRQHARWTPDIRGVNHCIMPSLNLDYAVPGYRWGGSYKIALQADNGITFQKISFATLKWTTPATALTLSDRSHRTGARPQSARPSRLNAPNLRDVAVRPFRSATSRRLFAWRSRDSVDRRRDIRCVARTLVNRTPPEHAQGGPGDENDGEHQRRVVPRHAVKAAEAQLGRHEHRIVVGQVLVLGGLQLFSFAEERHGPRAEARRRRLDLREQNDPSTRLSSNI